MSQQSIRILNCDNIRKKMKNAKVRSSSMKAFKTIPMEDANISKEEPIANQSALHNVQFLRNLPNILRNSNTRTFKNQKLFNKTDTSSAEDGNSSLELSTSSSIDLDMEASYNKITSPRLHQRKQVHNPLNVQCDISDCNNNKNKNILQKINQLNTLNVSLSREKNTAKKRLKYNNKQKKSSFNKKLKKITAHKTGSKMQTSHKKPNTLPVIPDVNVKNTTVMQNANNFLENDIFPQSIYNPNFPNINVNDLNDITSKPVESSNIFYNEVYNFEKKCDINDIISCKPTEIDTTQSKIIQKDITSYEFSANDNLQQKSMDSYIGSNFLYESKILYSCSCANCMSYDKDIIFYEDPISTFTSSDNIETELFTRDMYTNIYDFYTNNYFHIFGDDLMNFEKTNLYCEEFGESISTKENACNGNNNATELIESNANLSPINQNELQSLSCHIDGIKNICERESFPMDLATHPNEIVRTENVKAFNEANISNYLNLDSFSMKENKTISQDEILIQNAISSDVPLSNSKCQTPKNKRDLCVIQCSQCGKLFNKKHQLWKHFTHCNFYKENFKCHICNKMYRHKSSLIHHLRLMHNISHGSHEKFYTCNKCSKSYVRFRAFQRHVLLHDD